MAKTALATCDIPADWSNHFSQCLYEWQGLEAAGIALVAALVTAGFLWRQISQADRHENTRLRRQHNAIRTTLPLALSALCESLTDMLEELAKAKEAVRKDGHTKAFVQPQTPSAHIEQLRDVVATTDERSVTEPIAAAIREIQTLWARTSVLNNKAEQRRKAALILEIDDWIIQAARTHAIVESLFDYSRGKVEGGPSSVKWERAESIIFQLGIETSDLVKRIEAHVGSSEDLWRLDD